MEGETREGGVRSEAGCEDGSKRRWGETRVRWERKKGWVPLKKKRNQKEETDPRGKKVAGRTRTHSRVQLVHTLGHASHSHTWGRRIWNTSGRVLGGRISLPPPLRVPTKVATFCWARISIRRLSDEQLWWGGLQAATDTYGREGDH